VPRAAKGPISGGEVFETVPLPIVLVMLGALGAAVGPLVALASGSQVIQMKDVPSWQARGDPLLLPARDRSGRAREGEKAATARLTVSQGRLHFSVQAPATAGSPGSSQLLRLALILWNPGTPPLAPPNVLFVKAAREGDTTLGGHVVVVTPKGETRLVRSVGVWGKLGARATARWDAQGALVELSLPLAVLGELCPQGSRLDVRVQRAGTLYSYGPAANWSEPPDSDRTVAVSVVQAPVPPSDAPTPVRSLVASLGDAAVHPGAQLWVLSSSPLPLDYGYCGACDEVVQLRELARSGETSTAIDKLQHLVAENSPTDPAWQQAMLEIQTLWLGLGRVDNSIEAGLRILEAGGTGEATVVTALRTLATALTRAGIKLAGESPSGRDLRLRLLKAIADSNLQAAYGADLLMLKSVLPEAATLLEDVCANDSAPAAVRAHASFRLQQLRAHAGDWATAFDIAEQVQNEAPYNLALRRASLDVLRAWTPPDAGTDAQPENLRQRFDDLQAGFTVVVQDVNRRYFGGGPVLTPGSSCAASRGNER
jgi:hypothetical protein